MKKFKSLASTPLRKFTAVLSISVLSVSILCSCSNSKTAEIPEVFEQTVNQDADTTEEADKETVHQSNDTKPSTQHTNQSAEPTTQAHVHNYNKTETYYTTETKTVHHDAKTHTVHHDAVTHQETKYKTETIEIAGYLCDDGTFFEDAGEAAAYSVEHFLGYCSWVKEETVQVPYTETVVDQAAYDETVTDKPAWDEEVEVQVAHTREVCSCGATK